MKYLITILIILTALVSNAQVKIGPDGHMGPTGNYPAVNMRETRAFALSVASTTERDAIPSNFRDTGMLVVVRNDSVMYSLVGGITNDDWQAVTFSAGSSSAPSTTVILDSVVLSFDGLSTDKTFSLTQSGFKNIEIQTEDGNAGGFTTSFNDIEATLGWQVAITGDYKFFIIYFF